jgi:hypothetical protein
MGKIFFSENTKPFEINLGWNVLQIVWVFFGAD